MSQYKRYLEERTASKIIETEFGFVTYSFNDHGVYIEEIFVDKGFRHINKASELADEVAEIARKAGHKTMFGSVCPSAKGSTASLKVLLGYGMELHSATNNMIYFKKEIGV